jgi:hypothetical protein
MTECPVNEQRLTNNEMNINRHNYEEYFILYMDNELGNDERREVEDFVQKHPDLKEELDILFQYKMTPDNSIVFDGKEELMMHGGYSPVSLANYEEWLTMYIDNELTPGQKIEIEQFIATYPQVKKELEILQQTKLQPEEIIFSNKGSLYRREERVKIMPMRWWRIAAAAVLILVISLTTVVVINKKSSPPIDVAKIPGKEQKINKEDAAVKKQENKSATESVIAINTQQPVTTNPKQETDNVVIKHSISANKKIPGNLPVPVRKEEPILIQNNQKPSNNLPQPMNNSGLNNNISKTDITDLNIPKEIASPQKSLTNDDVTIQSTLTSYPVNNLDDDLNQSGGKKSKLRGFLRKVTRTFEKNTNINATDDEDRVLIGGLALKLK